ncbi:hypothetical protein GCM10010103_59650 [Streptomyces paradoxus]|uniref:Uncharacterized protein n=1 Tax=Streptomyces paradoxus TaxID=66375 RepID=A0A7W9TGN6_9ACTN|nr:hypothetical protein [Streptomyces paradoxus]
MPAIHPFVAIMGEGGSDHTPEFAEAAASPRAREVLLAVTEALACTAADVLLSGNCARRPGRGTGRCEWFGSGWGTRRTPYPPTFWRGP